MMLLAIASYAMAAVTIGGAVRFFLQSEQTGYMNNGKNTIDNYGKPEYQNDFKFDRIDLKIKADDGKGWGIDTLTQLRFVRTGTEAAVDIRNDGAFIYKNNLFTQGDSLRMGAFDPFPFKNGYGNASIQAGLGDTMKMAIATGAYYQLYQPTWGFAFGVCNGQYNAVANAAPGPNDVSIGYGYALRVDFMPITGLKAGFGYEMVPTANMSLTSNGVAYVYPKDGSSYYDTRAVIDCSYKDLKSTPFSGMVEYGVCTPTVGGTTYDQLSGMYVEGAYTFGSNVTLFAGRGIDLTSSTANCAPYHNNIWGMSNNSVLTGSGGGGINLFSLDNDYTVVGVTYPVGTNVAIQGEYWMQDDGQGTFNYDKTDNALLIRVMYSF